MPTKKKSSTKKVTKKVAKKATRKTVLKKTAKQTVKKVAKKVAKKTAAKKVVKKTNTIVVPLKKKSVTPQDSQKRTPNTLKKAVVSREGAAANKKSTPIVFSLDDVEELIAAKKTSNLVVEKPVDKKVTAKKDPPKVTVDEKPVEKRVIRGWLTCRHSWLQSKEKGTNTELVESEIPKVENTTSY